MRGTWPEGPFAIPERLSDETWRADADLPPIPVDEQRLLLATVQELAAQVQAHQRWAKSKGLTRVAVSRRAHTSESRLSAFESGAHWPEWDLPARLLVLRRADMRPAAPPARPQG